MRFIIEHMEPRLFKWCLLEYRHISKIVGSKNLWFTNIKTKSQYNKMHKLGRICKESFKDLHIEDVCILDQNATKTLSSADCKKFKYLVFGGILGDYPPRKRTSKMLVKGVATRNLGTSQMPTDHAVLVAKMIVSGKKFFDINFKDGITIDIDEYSSVDLPFRYVVKKGKVVLDRDLLDHIKKKGF